MRTSESAPRTGGAARTGISDTRASRHDAARGRLKAVLRGRMQGILPSGRARLWPENPWILRARSPATIRDGSARDLSDPWLQREPAGDRPRLAAAPEAAIDLFRACSAWHGRRSRTHPPPGYRRAFARRAPLREPATPGRRA